MFHRINKFIQVWVDMRASKLNLPLRTVFVNNKHLIYMTVIFIFNQALAELTIYFN